jgi:hypothetical protein
MRPTAKTTSVSRYAQSRFGAREAAELDIAERERGWAEAGRGGRVNWDDGSSGDEQRRCWRPVKRRGGGGGEL